MEEGNAPGYLLGLELWGMVMMVMRTMTAVETVGRPVRWTRLERVFLCMVVS